jgi:hypothetical protein
MDEKTRERSTGVDALQRALAEVARDIAAYVKEQLK